MNKFIADTLTEDELGKTWDPLRIAFAISFFTANGLAVYSNVIQGNPFDIMAYGTGMGALIGVTGVGIFASSNQKVTDGTVGNSTEVR